MASASSRSSNLGVTGNEKQWLVVGIALNKIFIPQIRPFVEQEVEKEYNKLKASHDIHGQSTSGRLQRWPARTVLKYENINGNDVHSRLPGGRFSYSLFDCRVTSHIDFARLYVENYMAKFAAFDEHCDASAVLLLLSRVPVFSAATQAAAVDVRMVRNNWTHCVFSEWDQVKFKQSFLEIVNLVKTLSLPTADKRRLLRELTDWEANGTQLCMLSPVAPKLLQRVQQNLNSLQNEVSNMSVDCEAEKTKIQCALQNCAGVLVDKKQTVVRLETELMEDTDRASVVKEECKEVQELLSFQDPLDGEKRSKTDDTYHELGGTEYRLKNVTSELHLEQRALHIRRKTKAFEAEHRECIRVLPYKDDGGQVYVHLYVHSGKNGISEDLKAAAQECFGKMEVEIKWFDLYNDAATVLNVTSVNYPSGKSKRLKVSQVDEVNKIIDENLSLFSRHRNITAVQASFKVSDSKETSDPCIMVYVLGKGHIPIGESEIPRFVGCYPIDIVNGFWIKTLEPLKPNNAQKQSDYLRLGASIGVNGEKSSGTLGAVLKDEKSDDLYLLSCYHVIKRTEESEIIHPGLDHHLNSVKYYLNNYRKRIARITELETKFSVDSLQEHEKLLETFTELKAVKEKFCALNNIGNQDFEKLKEYEKKLEKLFSTPPRSVASYTTGVYNNIKWSDGKEYFIDAAIAQLNQHEVKKLKRAGKAEIIDTEDYPSGECTQVTTKAIMNTEVLIKSGTATGYTSSDHLVGAAAGAPLFLQVSEFEVSDSLVSKFSRNRHCEEDKKMKLLAHSTRATRSYSTEVDGNEASQDEKRWLKNCLCVKSEKYPFANQGDSGSVIFEKPSESEFRLPGFGIIFGMIYSQHTLCVLASPLQISLETLSKKVSATCNLKLVSNCK